MFDQTPQQDKWYKKGACIKYRKQGYFIKNYRQGQRTDIVKNTNKP